jgi:peptidoglycan/xylan/chitin deacetylase (PgdA/CDA1 family)
MVTLSTPMSRRRWRWRVKAGLAFAISRSLSRTRSSGRAGYRPLVLAYHRMVEDYETAARGDMPSMLISTAMFERHIDWIGRHFRFVDLDQVGAHERSGARFREPVAAITFDDGYRDVYELAAPILKRKGIPAAVFVVTDLVGRPFWQVHDRLYHLVSKAFATWENPRRQLHGLLTDLGLPASDVLRARQSTSSPLMTVSTLLPGLSRHDVVRLMGYLESSVGNGFGPVPLTMTWPMLRQMRHDGFTVGSHTRTHVSLPMESPATMAAELAGAKQALDCHLGETTRHFAYPGGEFTSGVVEAAAQAGYHYGYTACRHRDHLRPELTIERLLLWEGSSIDADGRFSPDIFACQVNDLWPPARRCGRTHVR